MAKESICIQRGPEFFFFFTRLMKNILFSCSGFPIILLIYQLQTKSKIVQTEFKILFQQIKMLIEQITNLYFKICIRAYHPSEAELEIQHIHTHKKSILINVLRISVSCLYVCVCETSYFSCNYQALENAQYGLSLSIAIDILALFVWSG